MRNLCLASILAALSAVTACGSDSGGVCETYGNTVCDQACACTDGPGCVIAFGGGTSTIKFDKDSDCRAFYVNLACSQANSKFDYVGCTAVLDGAACVSTADGNALDHPACNMGN